MKNKLIKICKKLFDAVIQALAWGCIGLLVGMGIAVGFFATSVILLH
ncbi:Uncharacterised protein [[Eubacterium] contortum]|uniref:Uncharacterized protein n=1 Tax=Faecalicatena contorta TaxID=39482 RepID=A0A174JMY6_9FIRM|nr:hypothetical protein [Faecalicatena contorta]CUO99018.1 Uncharacterised protein [[Eubacterium] contortum] [Faecalicatena contorta]